jgi:hypothetical protein
VVKNDHTLTDDIFQIVSQNKVKLEPLECWQQNESNEDVTLNSNQNENLTKETKPKHSRR